jgi:hypothetical protein
MIRVFAFAVVVLAIGLGGMNEALSQEQRQGLNGHRLSRECNSEDYAYGQGYCYGYVTGTWHAFRSIAGQKWFCEPSDATVTKMVDAVVRYLADHPQRLGESALLLTLDAYKEAYPCAQ